MTWLLFTLGGSNMPKIMQFIERETNGKSYHTYKYSYDSIGIPSIEYDDDPNKVMKWKDSAETTQHKKAVDLKPLADKISGREPPLIKYFLDGSRHVFKVDDIAYNKQVYPVVAGQIGVGCCRREYKRMYKELFYPLRIAFDHWELRDVYEKAVRRAVKGGIKNLSNYLLYNFEDKPEDLYYRLKLNVDLCEELDASIYSFPMKYHPINDPKYFMNRDFIGKYWNRKFIRAIQAVLNSTKGKIGRGVDFFEEAFGRNVEEFRKILWMPETFIIYRRMYDEDLRKRLADRYTNHSIHDCNLTQEWWDKFSNLPDDKLEKAKSIIARNRFIDYVCDDLEIEEVLSYYRITRSIAEA